MVPTEGAEDGGPLNLQIEPEVALACRVVWHGDTVSSLQPFALGAFNDCSIRRPNAPKISYKKNGARPPKVLRTSSSTSAT
jgi:hypothetical protein